jgi:hypothetical protein|nr:MAG TPA: hypothetical protein [Caudoviricetes sp.]
MGNEVTQEVKNTSTDVFSKQVEQNANGVLANMFRRITGRLGLVNKLRNLCKMAQTRDKMYRMEINSPVFDEKLEYRLYQMATSPKMTFDGFTKLISHLFNVSEFKFSVSIKPKNSEEWITVEQQVFNTTGPITDLETLDEEEVELLKDSLKEEEEDDE